MGTEHLIACPRCGTPVQWTPAPTQKDSEDNWGPFKTIHDFIRQPARLSPPDKNGQTWLLVERRPGQQPSFWPAELNCARCRAEGAQAAAVWNALMRH